MKENTNTAPANEQTLAPHSHMGADLKNAVLIVSVVANLTIFVMWLTLLFTAQYDAALASFMLGR